MESIAPASKCEHVREFVDLFDVHGWRLVLTSELPDDIDGAVHWERRIVWLNEELSGPYARYVLEHERQHVLRGPAPGNGKSVILAEEQECDRLAAEAMRSAGYDIDPEWLYYAELTEADL